MTFAFGDDEPEDGWDRSDPLPVLLANLRRRVELLESGIAYDFPFVAELDAIAERLEAWRLVRATPAPRDRLRADQLADDIVFVRSRI